MSLAGPAYTRKIIYSIRRLPYLKELYRSLNCRNLQLCHFSHSNWNHIPFHNKASYSPAITATRGMTHSADDGCIHRKINSQVFKDIFVPELVTLREIFKRNNMEIRIAGGAVRDILLNIPPHDIDFATTAHPERMIEVFTKEGIRMLEYGSRAIGHGTVSVRINDTVSIAYNSTDNTALLCFIDIYVHYGHIVPVC